MAAFRLRHVQSVTLKAFDPGCQLPGDVQLHYELWRASADGRQGLLYVSEQVPLDFDLCWQPLSTSRCCVPPEQLHQPFTDLLQVTIRASQPDGTAAAPAPAAAGAAGPVAASTAATAAAETTVGGPGAAQQLHVASGSLACNGPSAGAASHQVKQELGDAKALHVCWVDGQFKVLLPAQLGLLTGRPAEEPQSKQQQQQPQQQPWQQTQPQQQLQQRQRPQQCLRVSFDPAVEAFKVSVGQPGEAAVQGPQQQSRQQQAQQPSCGADNSQKQLAPAAAAAGMSNVQTHPQQQQQQQKQQVHSPQPKPPAAAAASPSHAAVAAARQARHSRNSSGFSDAVLQLEQQLLGVFTTSTGLAAGRQLSSLGAEAATVPATADGAASAAASSSGDGGAAAGSSGDNNNASQQVQQQGQQQQQLDLQEDTWQRSPTGVDDLGHSESWTTPAETAAEAAEATAEEATQGAGTGVVARRQLQLCHNNSSSSSSCLAPGAAHSSSHPKGKLVLRFCFWVHELIPCSPTGLLSLQQAGQEPQAASEEQQPTNRLLLQLNGMTLALPPQAPALQQPGEGDTLQLSPMASGEDWVGLDGGFDSLKWGLAARQFGGQMAAVAQQQQLYRWMLSSSTGILDSLDHSYDEDEHSTAQHSRASSTGGSSGALSLLGALFNRKGPLTPLGTAALAGAAPAGAQAAAAPGEGSTASVAQQAAGAAQQAVVSAHQSPGQRRLPSVSSAASLATADLDAPAAAGQASGGSSPQHVTPVCGIGVGVGSSSSGLTTHGVISSSSGGGGGIHSAATKHRRSGSSTATSTATLEGASWVMGSASTAPGVAGHHRRAQSVSSAGVGMIPPHPRTPPSMAAHAATAAAAAAAAGASPVRTSHPAAAAAVDAHGQVGGTSGSMRTGSPISPAAAGASLGLAAEASGTSAAPSSIVSSSRLADSWGGSSTATTTAAAAGAGHGGPATPTAQAAPAAADAAAAAAAGGLPGLLQRGFLAGFSFWDWGAADDSVSLTPGGTAAERAAVERQYDLDDFVAATRRLVTLHQRLHHVQDRRNRIRLRVEALLQQQGTARRQQELRQAALQQQQAAAQLARVRQQQLASLQAQLEGRRQQLLARCEGVRQAAGALAAANGRLRDAWEVLEGPNGLGRWKALHGQLVARRNRMVAQLGHVFQVGPASRSPFAAAPLALQLDASWWAVDPDTAAEAASDAGDPQQQPAAAAVLGSIQAQWAASSNIPQLQPPLQQLQQQPASHAPSTPTAQHRLQQQQQQQAVYGGSPLLAESQAAAVVDRLLVGGLELPAGLAKRGLQGSMGWGGDLDEEARIAAALGYVAQIVCQLAAYLDVPLRYPLVPRSSRSLIVDPAPLHLQGLEGQVHRRFWGFAHPAAAAAAAAGVSAAGAAGGPSAGGSGGIGSMRGSPGGMSVGAVGGSSPGGVRGVGALLQQQQQQGAAAAPVSPAKALSSPAAARPALQDRGGVAGSPVAAAAAVAAAVEGGISSSGGDGALQLPLFYTTGDRTRFAYAVFLLNKDIEQLLHAHGMSSQGPSQVLGNLYKLISAAVSGLPSQQQWQQQQQQQHTRGSHLLGRGGSGQQPLSQQQPQKLGGSSGDNGAAQQHAPTGSKSNSSAVAAEAAAKAAGAGASWLQHLPLPPAHTPQPQHDPLARQQQQQHNRPQGQVQQPLGASPLQQQQQQQQQQRVPDNGGFWRWPWQSDAQQAAAAAPNNPPSQQQQQRIAQAVATWDWGELTTPAQQNMQQLDSSSASKQQLQQQQQHVVPVSNGGFDLQAWQQQSDAQLQAAEQAAVAAAAAAAAADKAAAVAQQLMLQGTGPPRQQQQQRGREGGAAGNGTHSVASLLSLKWAGDGDISL